MPPIAIQPPQEAEGADPGGDQGLCTQAGEVVESRGGSSRPPVSDSALPRPAAAHRPLGQEALRARALTSLGTNGSNVCRVLRDNSPREGARALKSLGPACREAFAGVVVSADVGFISVGSPVAYTGAVASGVRPALQPRFHPPAPSPTSLPATPRPPPSPPSALPRSISAFSRPTPHDRPPASESGPLIACQVDRPKWTTLSAKWTTLGGPLSASSDERSEPLESIWAFSHPATPPTQPQASQPAPCTLHSTPHTLHSPPYTLHPTPEGRLQEPPLLMRGGSSSDETSSGESPLGEIVLTAIFVHPSHFPDPHPTPY